MRATLSVSTLWFCRIFAVALLVACLSLFESAGMVGPAMGQGAGCVAFCDLPPTTFGGSTGGSSTGGGHYSDPGQTYSPYFDTHEIGERLADQGNWDRARTVFEDALRLATNEYDRRNAATWINFVEARSLYDAHDYRSAISKFQQANATNDVAQSRADVQSWIDSALEYIAAEDERARAERHEAQLRVEKQREAEERRLDEEQRYIEEQRRRVEDAVNRLATKSFAPDSGQAAGASGALEEVASGSVPGELEFRGDAPPSANAARDFRSVSGRSSGAPAGQTAPGDTNLKDTLEFRNQGPANDEHLIPDEFNVWGPGGRDFRPIGEVFPETVEQPEDLAAGQAQDAAPTNPGGVTESFGDGTDEEAATDAGVGFDTANPATGCQATQSSVVNLCDNASDRTIDPREVGSTVATVESTPAADGERPEIFDPNKTDSYQLIGEISRTPEQENAFAAASAPAREWALHNPAGGRYTDMDAWGGAVRYSHEVNRARGTLDNPRAIWRERLAFLGQLRSPDLSGREGQGKVAYGRFLAVCVEIYPNDSNVCR